MTTSLLIGITGGSGSGKTYLLELLKEALPEGDICVVSQDNYYKPIKEQFIDANGVENFDLPDSIDHEAFFKDLSTLKSGKSIQRNEYVFNNLDAIPKILKFEPSRIIIAEGIFVFHNPDVLKILDYKVYVECKLDVMIQRRIQRDAVERGYDMEDVKYRYEHHVLPAYNEYIQPYKHKADLVIVNNGHMRPLGLDELIRKMLQLL